MHFYFLQIDALEKPFKLPLSESHLGFCLILWPAKAVLLQNFPPHGETRQIPIDHLDGVFPFVREHEKGLCIERLLSQCFLRESDQTMGMFAKVRRRGRNENPRKVTDVLHSGISRTVPYEVLIRNIFGFFSML